MNLRQIQDIAGHRDVPPWVIKLVQDCIEHDRMYERAQPQGDWVDLTDDEILECAPIRGATVESVAIAVAAKLKETNTPPVVQQGEPVGYVTEPQNLLPNGLTLLQTNPDCAVQLNSGRDFGWLYMKGADGQWVTHRKLSPEEINEAQDQAADMVVVKRESVFEKMFAAPIANPPVVPQEPVAWSDAALLSLMNSVGDGPYGEEDIAVTRRFMEYAEQIRPELITTPPSVEIPKLGRAGSFGD